jgi:hypothetical protein
MKFKFGLRKALMQEMDLTPPEGQDAIEGDPFLLLGYGVNAYFDILQ